MDNAKKYSLKAYKRDNVIHETMYYEIYENSKSESTTTDRIWAYQHISYLAKTKPQNNYKLYLHTIQRIKTRPNEQV